MDEKEKERIIYFFKIKEKIESLLQKMVDFYNLNSYISYNKKYSIDMEKLYNAYLNEKETKNGVIIPISTTGISFDDWLNKKFPDYLYVVSIYEVLLKNKIITKKSLIELNKIWKKYENGGIKKN